MKKWKVEFTIIGEAVVDASDEFSQQVIEGFAEEEIRASSTMRSLTIESQDVWVEDAVLVGE